MPKVTIDGVEIEVPANTTILNAARMMGGPSVPPAMCYYSSLKESGGKCRVCLVKIAQNSTKDPRPGPKLVASCCTSVQDGMVVENLHSPEVLEARKGIVEFLLLNHPSIARSVIRQVNVTFKILPMPMACLKPAMKKIAVRSKRSTLVITSSFI